MHVCMYVCMYVLYVHVYIIVFNNVFKFSLVIFGGPEKDRLICLVKTKFSTAESVQGTSLAFQSVDDIHGGDSLPLCVLGVGNGITDDILKENLQDTTGLFVDQTGDTFDTTSSCQTTDCGLGDSLDVITQNLPVTLSAPLSETLSSFTTSRHSYSVR